MAGDRKEKISIFGMEIDNISLKDALRTIHHFVEDSSRRYIVTPNAQHVVLVQKDREFRSVYEEASLVLTDSMPIIWISRILGRPLRERITGSDLLPAFCHTAARKGYRLFFLGAGPGVASKAAQILIQRNPGLKIVDTYSPPYGFEGDGEENKKVVKRVKAARPDVLFVGLGAPKQEKWIWKHKDELNVPVSICVGAAFDFIADNVRRAPKWMQKIGLEWLFRLCKEPRRLWKRYLIGNIIFLWLVVKEFVRIKVMKT